jgi:2-phospho-L-lactate guanylyltransferase (CobY/MobA/RfbA family)
VVEALGGDGAARAVLVRSRDNGTNALALRPPDAIGMHFGRNSADAHRAAAETAGIAVVEVTNERLAYDIDSADDLAELPRLPVGAATRGWIDAHARYAAER